jgi:hypothetical protein
MSFHFLWLTFDDDGTVHHRKYDWFHKRKTIPFRAFKKNGKYEYSPAEYRHLWAEGYHSAREYEKLEGENGWMRKKRK